MNPVLTWILIAVGILNVISFFLMALDKRLACRRRRRIPEKVLFLSALLFGALGGTAGIWIFRHKTKHWYFRLFFPLLVVAQAAVLAYAISRYVI